MTSEQITMIKDSWKYVETDVKDPGNLFYNRLFALDPQLRHLFKSNLNEQSKKLIKMIGFVVSKLDNLDSVLEDVKALGRRHKNYHVDPTHYQTVGAALIWTLQQSLGEKWNPQLEAAWIEAYTILSNTMIEAAK